MPRYRCYCLDREHRIIAVAEGTYRDDTAAILWADTLLKLAEYKACTSVEVWRDAHLVHKRE